MISPEVFTEHFDILCEMCNRDPKSFSTATRTKYYERLNLKIASDEEFIAAFDVVFDSLKFFPSPNDFAEALQGSNNVQAAEEWETVVLMASRGDRDLSKLCSPTQRAIQLIGGMRRIEMATEDHLPWLKKEFVQHWKDTEKTQSISDAAILASSETPQIEKSRNSVELNSIESIISGFDSRNQSDSNTTDENLLENPS